MLTAVIPLLLVPAAPVALAELAIRGRTDGSTGMREVLTQVVPSRLIILARDPYMSALVLGALSSSSTTVPSRTVLYAVYAVVARRYSARKRVLETLSAAAPTR
jgi:cytochrome c oxidase assembly factor CtaG